MEYLGRRGSEPENLNSSNPGANFQTAIINRTLQDTRKSHRRRERLTLVHETLRKLNPPDKDALEHFWKNRFKDTPTNNLPFEPASLSIHDLARAANLREDKLVKHVQILKKHNLVKCDGNMYFITPRGQKVLAKLNKLLCDSTIHSLIEDLERTIPA